MKGCGFTPRQTLSCQVGYLVVGRQVETGPLIDRVACTRGGKGDRIRYGARGWEKTAISTEQVDVCRRSRGMWEGGKRRRYTPLRPPPDKVTCGRPGPLLWVLPTGLGPGTNAGGGRGAQIR